MLSVHSLLSCLSSSSPEREGQDRQRREAKRPRSLCTRFAACLLMKRLVKIDDGKIKLLTLSSLSLVVVLVLVGGGVVILVVEHTHTHRSRCRQEEELLFV